MNGDIQPSINTPGVKSMWEFASRMASTIAVDSLRRRNQPEQATLAELQSCGLSRMQWSAARKLALRLARHNQ